MMVIKMPKANDKATGNPDAHKYIEKSVEEYHRAREERGKKSKR